MTAFPENAPSWHNCERPRETCSLIYIRAILTLYLQPGSPQGGGWVLLGKVMGANLFEGDVAANGTVVAEGTVA